tara:strand:- start:396 stop:833 length:438 start_codon:yes stop_codon:yes gene_type:complete
MNYTDVFESQGPGLQQVANSLNIMKQDYKGPSGVNPYGESQASPDSQTTLIEAQSDLRNLSRPLSKNFFKQYQPDETTQTSGSSLDDYYKPSKVQHISPSFDFREFGINRWEFLPIDPQKNAVEPFRRLGENTVLQTLDAHKTHC